MEALREGGAPAWEGFVPGYNLYVWNKLIGKPWWWLIPAAGARVNLLMLIIMNVNLSIAYGQREFRTMCS